MLSACGATPSLWGVYVTPTTDVNHTPIPTQTIEDPAPQSTATTNPSLPTPTREPISIPPTPTQEATVTPVVALSQNGAQNNETPTAEVAPVLYYAQSGDTLAAVAARFEVEESEITSSVSLPKKGLINPGTLLVIPERFTEYGPNVQIMPDAEIVFSISAADFDVKTYVDEAGGDLSSYREFLNSGGWITGSQAIERIAQENSINPRILLALLDYEGNWVSGSPTDFVHEKYPMGIRREFKEGVFTQTVLAVNELFVGYYGWRAGTLTELTFSDGQTLRIAPDLNAGTVALQYFFSKLYNQSEWQSVIDPNVGFPAFYAENFGDPWVRAENTGPIFPPGLTQPTMVLPFEPNREWAYTGGPHGAWEHKGPFAAIDFAPATEKPGCTDSEKWLVAAAPGLVVQSGDGIVVLDLDGDGYGHTGWNLLYLHVGTKNRVKLDTWLEVDDRIGHASCEGGVSTGTHLHIARKYNGEWVLADGPLPFILSGYRVHNGEKIYEGTLTKGEITITAHPGGVASSTIFRQSDE